jgi:hypothetical protein
VLQNWLPENRPFPEVELRLLSVYEEGLPVRAASTNARADLKLHPFAVNAALLSSLFFRASATMAGSLAFYHELSSEN